MFNRIRKLSILICLAAIATRCPGQAGIITTIAGGGPLKKSASNGAIATDAQLNTMFGIATDAAGNCYITQPGAVRMINTSGVINTVAGIDTFGYAGDGLPATNAELSQCMGVTTDLNGNFYVADRQGPASFSIVRKVDPGGTITTYAGNGVHGSIGGGGPAISCELGMISDLATDRWNNLYMADADNHVVWKVDNSGIINVVAGSFTAGYGGDGGPATTAQFHSPTGVAIDNSGNLYIADATDHVVRMVNATGVVTTVAGNGVAGYNGDGHAATAAQLNAPKGLGADAAGNVYIADVNNNGVRKLSPDGTISTVAGNGTAGYSGNGGPAINATLRMPADVAIDGAGNMYIADYGNRVVRKVSSTLGVDAVRRDDFVVVYPNPCREVINLHCSITGPVELVLENNMGQVVSSRVIDAKYGQTEHFILPADISDGSYILRYRSPFQAGFVPLSIIR